MSQGSNTCTLSHFLVIWFGQFISTIGSGLTGFALGIWVYQRTGSITYFAVILLCAGLPTVVLAPFAGVIVDRHDHRTTIICSDLAGAISALALASLFFVNHLFMWELYLLVALNSLSGTFRIPAYLALVSWTIPAEQFGRVSGMIQLGPGIAQVLCPILAVALIQKVGFSGVILIDMASFMIAVLSLLSVRIPKFCSSGRVEEKRSLLKEAAQGWSYIMERPGLTALLAFFVLFNLTLCFSQALLTPMILSFTTPTVLGRIMSAGAIGILTGSAFMSVWGGPANKVHGLLGFSIVYAIGLLLTGLRPSATLIACGIFVMVFAIPIMNGCSQAIWQRKTEIRMQGRVFGMSTTISRLANPLAFFLAGPLTEHVFKPLLEVHGPFAGTWLTRIGTGPGRGAALFLILNGTLMLIAALGGYFNNRFRHVDAAAYYYGRASR